MAIHSAHGSSAAARDIRISASGGSRKGKGKQRTYENRRTQNQP
jgi:hypothetical protein